ncbi:hypothetical protein GY45DRAFT_1398292 [Cubamyces sp. BRFM 1775]|nr:hypothetical protein GY45DRAFT_1398292 [Cubamyces sp. BRFM 1775]
MSTPAGRSPATGLVIRNPPQHNTSRSRSQPYTTPRRESPGHRSVSSQSPNYGNGLLSIQGSVNSLDSHDELPSWAGEGDASPPHDSNVYDAIGYDSHPAPRIQQSSSSASRSHQYPLYTPPGSDPSGASFSHPASLDVERTLHQYQLQGRRGDVHQFLQLNMDAKLSAMFLHVLKLEQAHTALHEAHVKLEQENAALNSELKEIKQLCQLAWHPSKAQMRLIRSLVRHYIVKPMASYNTLADHAKHYISQNASKLRLELYNTDQTVRVTLNTHINEVVNQMKSAFRKALFVACRNSTPLESFTRNMLDNYHLPAIPAETPVALLGTFAMMRRIALPLAQQSSNGRRGGDTGFWRAVENELENAYNTITGKDRNNDAEWISWSQTEIAGDHERFRGRRSSGRRSRRSGAATTGEEDTSFLFENTGENLDSGLTNVEPIDIPLSLGAAGQDLTSGDEDEEMGDGGDDVPSLTSMGDIAATIPYS